MTALATELPSPGDFLQPLQALTGWSAPDHRNARRVQRDAMLLISHLEFVASIRVDIGVKHRSETRPESQIVAEGRDAMLEVLEAARALHTNLVSGISIRRVQRDVKQFVPQLQGRLQDAVDEARKHAAELRAVFAFMVDETDDEELGIELFPDVGEPLEPEDSSAAPA